MPDKKINIVTAYYNRKPQFIKTLRSIAKTQYTNFEMIVVDDCSDKEHRLEDLVFQFPFIKKLIRLEPENKWYVNPSIPFNIGIKAVSEDTDIVVLQNPECYHVHDILTYFNNIISDNNYISISMYFLPEDLTKIMPEDNSVKMFLKSLPLDGWRNHSKIAPEFYHFCAALSKVNLDKLGGFDEKYAHGICLEDCDFIDRIRKLGMYLKIEDNLSVIHQYHPTVFYNRPDTQELFEINKKIHKGKNI